MTSEVASDFLMTEVNIGIIRMLIMFILSFILPLKSIPLTDIALIMLSDCSIILGINLIAKVSIKDISFTLINLFSGDIIFSKAYVSSVGGVVMVTIMLISTMLIILYIDNRLVNIFILKIILIIKMNMSSIFILYILFIYIFIFILLNSKRVMVIVRLIKKLYMFFIRTLVMDKRINVITFKMGFRV